jgi:hypothetical protein
MLSKINKRILRPFTKRLLLIVTVILFFSSCHIFQKKYIIPEKKLIKVLVDIHLADAIAMVVTYSDPANVPDSAQVYSSLFKKHHITQAQFDSTMAYYAHKPEKLVKIYTAVNTILNKRESEVIAEGEKSEPEKKIITWQDNKIYILPQMGKREKIEVSIPVSKTGIYTLSAKIKMYEDDQSVAPRITMFFWYDNGTPKGYREYFSSTQVLKNGQADIYSVTHQLTNPNITHLKGFILDHSNPDTLFTKHAIVSEIKVFFKE